MEERRILQIEDRLWQLERHVSNLYERLGAPQKAPEPTRPEPVRQETTPVQPRFRPSFDLSPPPPPPASTPPASEHAAMPPAPDNEFTLGAKVLPRVGASLVILGIAFLVSMGIQRGIIGPWVQFACAIALSLGFLVFGFRLRDTKAEFGHVLMAVGSSGLFLTTAGGHAFGDLYPADGVVGSFLLLGLGHLAYALRTASKTFFVFGLFGGVAGALLPMQKGNEALAMGLLAVVIAASAVCVLRHDWRRLGLLVSLFAFGPTLALGQQLIQLPCAMIQGAALMFGVALHARLWQEDDVESSPLFGALLFAFGSFIIAIGLDGSLIRHFVITYPLPPGTVSAFLVGLGLAVVPVALIAKDARAKHALWVAGAVVATLLSPALLPQPWNVAAFASLLVVASFAGSKLWTSGLRVASSIYACAASLTYVAFAADGGMLSKVPVTAYALEVLLLGAISLGIFQTIRLFASDRDESLREFVGAAGVILLSLATLRLGSLSAAFFAVPVAQTIVIACLLALIAIALSYASRAAAMTSLSFLALASLVSSLVLYATQTAAAAMPNVGETALIGILLVALQTTYRATQHWARQEGVDRTTGAVPFTLLGFVALCLVSRVVALWLLDPSLSTRAFLAGGIVFALAATGLFLWRDSATNLGVRSLGWTSLFVASSATLPITDMGPESWRYVGWALMILAWASMRVSTKQKGMDLVMLESCAVLAVGFYLTTILLRAAPGLQLGLSHYALVSLLWTLYAALLLFLGFACDVASLRKWAIGGFLFTAFKVVLVDLSMIDTAIRVVLLISLGGAMIGGGYVYVRKLIDRPAE